MRPPRRVRCLGRLWLLLAASCARFTMGYFNCLRLNPASTNLRTSSATDSPVFLLNFSKASRWGLVTYRLSFVMLLIS
jgi:hypothetical protein